MGARQAGLCWERSQAARALLGEEPGRQGSAGRGARQAGLCFERSQPGRSQLGEGPARQGSAGRGASQAGLCWERGLGEDGDLVLLLQFVGNVLIVLKYLVRCASVQQGSLVFCIEV